MPSPSNPVGWFELYVTNLPRAKAFYEALFQHPMDELPSPPGVHVAMVAFPMNPCGTGSAGALVKHPTRGPSDSGTLVYFSCQNCAVEAARAAAHGGQIVQPKTQFGRYGHIALVRDTEGNMIGLHSRD